MSIKKHRIASLVSIVNKTKTRWGKKTMPYSVTQSNFGPLLDSTIHFIPFEFDHWYQMYGGDRIYSKWSKLYHIRLGYSKHDETFPSSLHLPFTVAPLCCF